jgi:subtilisin family serine protease
LADAIAYVFRIAEDRGCPAVVNLSLGAHHDAHDGTDPLSQVVDDESGPGRIVCCAAGNEGEADIHGRVDLSDRDDLQSLTVAVPDDTTGSVTIYGWYSGQSKLEVSVTSPGGGSTPFQVALAGSPDLTDHVLDNCRVSVSTPGPDVGNGDHAVEIVIRGESMGSPVKQGTWRLDVRNLSDGAVRFDAWLCNKEDDASSPKFVGAGVQAGMKIGSPGSARSAITVAAYASKEKWISQLSGAQSNPKLAVGSIASFSSDGPLRDGSEKPELAAPGALIAAALSKHSSVNAVFRLSAEHVVLQGTSMAAPFISGIVALLLERDPALGPDEIKNALRNASRIPGYAAGKWDAKWGYGLLSTSFL